MLKTAKDKEEILICFPIYLIDVMYFILFKLLLEF